MNKQLAFVINGPNCDYMIVLFFVGIITATGIIAFVTDLFCKEFGKISFTVSVIGIAIVVACCNYGLIQDKKLTSTINALAKEYPKMTVVKIDKNDDVFYFESKVKHNSDNIIKNEIGYEVSQKSDDNQFVTVHKIKPQAIFAQEIKENQDTKKSIIKFNEEGINNE